MSVTEHEVRVKFTGDTKSVEAGTKRIAKEANKLSKQQKTDFGETLKRQKQTQKLAGPQQQRQLTGELKKQNQEYRLTNRLLTQMAAGWQRVAQAAKNAAKAVSGGGAGRGRGSGGGGPPGFWAGVKRGGDFGGPGMSRYGLGHGLATGARAGIGLAGGGLAALATAPIAAISSDYQAFVTYQRSLGSLSGLNKGARFGAGYTLGGVDKLTEKMGHFGYMPEEVANAARMFGRSTGTSKSAGYGMVASKALGMDVSEISGMFGELRRGAGGFGAEQKSDFQKMLAAGVKAGVDASTLPEYLEGLSSLTGRAGSAAGGAVSALPYAQLLAMFQKSGAAGLKGARGASVLGSLEEGFKSPGGGDEGLAVIMGSLGFGRAGGNTSYYQAKKMMQQGFQGEGGAGNLKNLFDYVDRITGGGEEANLYMEGLMGGRLTLDQLETVRGAFGKGASTEDVDKMLASMTATELDVLHSIDDNMKEFLSAGSRAAHVQKQDIDRGALTADSIERMQDILHDFFNKVAEPIAEVLPRIADGLEFMTSGMTKLVEVFTKESTVIPDAAAAEAAFDKAIKLEKVSKQLETNPDSVSDTQLREIVAANAGAAAAIRQYGEQESFGASVQEMLEQAAIGLGLTEGNETTADIMGRQRSERIDRAAEALDRLADRLNRGNDVDPARINTERELIAAMQALGIAIPAGSRALIDSTGGSP